MEKNSLKRKGTMSNNSENESHIDNPRPSKILITTPIINSESAEMSYLKLQLTSLDVEREFKLLAGIDESLLKALVLNREQVMENRENFIKDFPSASQELMREFDTANAENNAINDLENARGEQALRASHLRKELVRIKEKFESEYPDFKPQNGKFSITSKISAPATRNEEILAFFTNNSPKDISKEIPRSLLLPRYIFATCEKSYSRATLPEEYLARINAARLFPNHTGHNSYDTTQVINRIVDPTHRSHDDSFITINATVWILNPKSGKYEPHPKQQIVNLGRHIFFDELFKEKVIYVAMARNDVKKMRKARAPIT